MHVIGLQYDPPVKLRDFNQNLKEFNQTLLPDYFYFFVKKASRQSEGSGLLVDPGHLSFLTTNINKQINRFISFNSGEILYDFVGYSLLPWIDSWDYRYYEANREKFGGYYYHLCRGIWETFEEEFERVYNFEKTNENNNLLIDSHCRYVIGFPLSNLDENILDSNICHVKENRTDIFSLCRGIVVYNIPDKNVPNIREHVGTFHVLKKNNCVNPIYTIFYRKGEKIAPSPQMAAWSIMGEIFPAHGDFLNRLFLNIKFKDPESKERTDSDRLEKITESKDYAVYHHYYKHKYLMWGKKSKFISKVQSDHVTEQIELADPIRKHY